MNTLKKFAPWIAVLLILALAYFMYAKNRLVSILQKTTATEPQIKAIEELAKTGVVMLYEEETEVSVLVTYKTKAEADKNAAKLKLLGFDPAPDSDKKFVAIFPKK